jgi:hypothetical protein
MKHSIAAILLKAHAKLLGSSLEARHKMTKINEQWHPEKHLKSILGLNF